jgi:competence ComEA-like helix-hairpin-helix protein
MFNKISKKIGFTETEVKVIIFLISALIIGFGYKTFFKKTDIQPYKTFDYSEEDSLFTLTEKTENIPQKKDTLSDKNVDYKQEVLDFNKTNFQRSEKKVLPTEKSIDINKADLKIFTTLPGIGEKTAQKILNFRTENNGFKKLEDLLKVKGIGQVKFKNIKKYLFIEK